MTLDFSLCRSRGALYDELSAKMDWQSWYGRNLDALWDILTTPPCSGKKFRIIPPDSSADESVREYAGKIESIFRRAGVLDE